MPNANAACRRLRPVAEVIVGLAMIPASQAQDDQVAAHSGEELTKKLQNPVASLISVPFQSNFEFDGGSDDEGFRYLLNIQPVIPISISEDWNLISRTILPIIHQDDMIGSDTQSGRGDITQSAFFSPKAPGPVFVLPTATDDLLGAEQFGIGPTAVLLMRLHWRTLRRLLASGLTRPRSLVTGIRTEASACLKWPAL